MPITVKMRTGIYDKNWNAHELIPKIRGWGASLVTVCSIQFCCYSITSILGSLAFTRLVLLLCFSDVNKACL